MSIYTHQCVRIQISSAQQAKPHVSKGKSSLNNATMRGGGGGGGQCCQSANLTHAQLLFSLSMDHTAVCVVAA